MSYQHQPASAGRIEALLFFAAVAVYALFWSRFGFDTRDAGYVLGVSWRVLQGQVPYADFTYVRPPLTPWLHVLPLLLGDWAVYADRVITAVQVGVMAYVSARVLVVATGRPDDRALFWASALAAYLLCQHNFVSNGWYTTDGAFFGVLAIACLQSRRTLTAGALFAAAALCKQNYAILGGVLTLLTLVLSGVRPAMRVVVGGLVAGLVALAILAAQGGLAAMIFVLKGAGSASDIWHAGVEFYKWQLLGRDTMRSLPLAAVAFVVLSVFRRPRDVRGWVAQAYVALAIGLIGVFLWTIVKTTRSGEVYL